VNPLASHWFRVAMWLGLLSPVLAFLVVLTTDADFGLAINVTVSMWVLVCVILALIAFAGLLARVIGWGIRAIRR